MAYEADLSLEAMRRICKKAGAERVSKSATLELAEVLNEVGIKIAKEAIEYTHYARRRTVRAKDIKAAYEKLFKSKKSYSFQS